MFSVVFLLALLAFSVTGLPAEVRNSPITLPMTRRLAFSNITDLLQHDEARLAAFGEYSTHDQRDADSRYPSVTLTHANLGNKFSGYTVEVGFGQPPNVFFYNLIIDTASAITWVGARLPYLSPSGVDTGEPVAVHYSYGSFTGTIFQDDLIIGVRRLIIPAMQIGVATTSPDGIAADGVLGIGPRLLGLGALQNSRDQTIPTVTDCLLRQHVISRPIVGLFFQPIVANTVNLGEISFGGTDPAMYVDNDLVEYTYATTTGPSSQYWGFKQRITYANREILANTAGIVDSGCTFLYLASDAYEGYKFLTGGVLNLANGLLQISPQQYDQLHNLEFHIGSRVLRLIPNAQIWPRSLNSNINGADNDIYLIVKSLERPTGAGIDFVNGYVFIQRYYTVLDGRSPQRVGFVQTVFTNADTN
ncbi:aspartic peptidase A1 [Suillus decipiens]|nr:aspartic peptidase A1 [Suillus decipiens]